LIKATRLTSDITDLSAEETGNAVASVGCLAALASRRLTANRFHHRPDGKIAIVYLL